MDNYKVIGMTCVVCSQTVEKAVLNVEGVQSCNVNLLMNSMQVEGSAQPEAVCEAVRLAGYKARFISGSAEEEQDLSVLEDDKSAKEEQEGDTDKVAMMIGRLAISVVILLILMYFSTGYRLFGYSLPEFLISNSILLYIIEVVLSLAIIAVNGNYFISGFRSIIHRAPNMDALISLGAISAFLYSAIISVQNIVFYGNMGEYIGDADIYFDTCAMILVLISVGKIIEEKAKGKTTNVLKELTSLSPTTAIIMTDNGEKELPIEEVKVGDIFVLKPGMRVPVDGVVETGVSAVDESSLTGESLPVDKFAGSTVSAATINMSGYMTCRATGVGENTAFSHIVQMVKDASNGKVSFSKASDRASSIIIPIVIIVAVVTLVYWMLAGFGFGFGLSRAIAVLIISCPCALGLATPVAVVVGSSIGAKHGILFKNAQSLENTGRTQIVVVDKTGTITTGEPKVTDIISIVDDMEHRDLLLTVAYSIESKSEHPLARAICKYAEKRYVRPIETINFEAQPGMGIKADLMLADALTTVYAGNEAYIARAILGQSSDEDGALFESDFTQITGQLVAHGKTPLIFATQKGLLGIIAVSDEIKESSKEVVDIMHEEDIHVVMVTGDRYETARAVADEIGISHEEVLSEVLPQDKADIVNKLRMTGKVAMIGDGINDAPALTSADIGIAIGAGTDVAVDAADVVLIQDSLVSAVDAIRISRKTLAIIHQNLFWTFFYNILGIPLAAGCFYRAFGWLLNPMFCAFAMSISSVIVILNSLRLFRFNGIHVSSTQSDEDAENQGVTQ